MIMQVDKARVMADQAKARLDNLKKVGGKGGSNEAIEKAAKEFEAVFLAQMMEHMFADVDLSPGSEGPGDDIYKTLLIDEYSKLMSRSGGIGVADHVKREMIRMQESEHALKEIQAEMNVAADKEIDTDGTLQEVE